MSAQGKKVLFQITSNPVIITVDYGCSLMVMIDRVPLDCEQHEFEGVFASCVTGVGIKRSEACLVSLCKCVRAGSVLEEISGYYVNNLWVPAGVEHILAYEAQYHDVNRKHSIIGLGSVGKMFEQEFVPVLGRNDDGFELYMEQICKEWELGSKFMMVRELGI